MSSNVRQLLENGVPIYPITEKSLVIGLQDAPFESYIVAWDGTAAPTVANVPAGVVINYSGTDYTGTLAASSSTAPYLYLVASTTQQGEYDRYITTRSGSSFVWTALGSTAPVSPVIADDLVTNDSSKALSAKQGKILNDNLGQLDQIETDIDLSAYSWTDDEYVRYDTGNTVSSSFASAIENIDVSKLQDKTISYARLIIPSHSGYQGMAFYDENHTYISGRQGIIGGSGSQAGLQEDTIQVPNTAVYASFSAPTTMKADFFVAVIDNLHNYIQNSFNSANARINAADNGIASLGLEQRPNVNMAWTDGEYYDSSGNVASSANFERLQIDVSSFVGCPFWAKLRSSDNASAWCFIVDADNLILKSIRLISDNILWSGIIPFGAKYLRLSNRKATGEASVYIAGFSNIVDYKLSLSGKTVAFIGDSITEGRGLDSVSDVYHQVFAGMTGCTNVNLGLPGTCIARHTKNGLDSQRFVTRATVADIGDADMVVVFGGTNDFSYDEKAIGSNFVEETISEGTYIGNKKLVAPTDEDAFPGALHNLIQTIRTSAPTIPILFLTPLKRGRYTDDRPISSESNVNGDYLSDFVSSIKEICAFYSIPVLDLNGVSQLDFTNEDIAAKYSIDTLHPNKAGHEIIAKLLYNFVNQTIVM